MESLHRHLHSIHPVDDLSQYELLLAVFKKTRSLEIDDARQHYQQLGQLCRSLNIASYTTLHSLIDTRLLAPTHLPTEQ
jgi:hypothetical protein